MATPEREAVGKWPHHLKVGCSLSKLHTLALDTKAPANTPSTHRPERWTENSLWGSLVMTGNPEQLSVAMEALR